MPKEYGGSKYMRWLDENPSLLAHEKAARDGTLSRLVAADDAAYVSEMRMMRRRRGTGSGAGERRAKDKRPASERRASAERRWREGGRQAAYNRALGRYRVENDPSIVFGRRKARQGIVDPRNRLPARARGRITMPPA